MDQRDKYTIDERVQTRDIKWDGAEDVTTWIPATVCALGKTIVGVEYHDGRREMCSPENVRKAL